jgi:hypothetical protein
VGYPTTAAFIPRSWEPFGGLRKSIESHVSCSLTSRLSDEPGSQTHKRRRLGSESLNPWTSNGAVLLSEDVLSSLDDQIETYAQDVPVNRRVMVRGIAPSKSLDSNYGTWYHLIEQGSTHELSTRFG